MSTAYATTHRRGRQVALGGLTILLHVLVFLRFGSQAGRVPDRAAHAARAPMTVDLVAVPVPAPRPLPSVPPLPPQPALAPPPLPEVMPEPVVSGQTGHGGDVGSAGAVQSYPDARAGAEPAAPPAALPPRRYKTDLPPPADIALDVVRTDADGTRWSGDALLSWRIAPSGYRIQVEAGIGAVPARVHLFTLVSEGKVGDDGFVPILMTEKRRGRAMTATHFNRQDGTLTFSASAAQYALAPGAQDKASVPLQLAAIARGDPRQLSGNIDILVGEDREASVFTFIVAGRETIDTRLGPIAAWHLVRAPGPGSYDARLELWLAPDYGWYPVRIRNVEASGAVTTRTVNNIVIKQAGS